MENSGIKRGIYNCPNCGSAATPESVRCAYCHSSLATLVCSSCFGAIFIGMKHCPWCGTSASAGNPVERIPGKCPRCNTDLLRIRVGSRSLCECTGCGGLWVDKDTLQDICTSREEQQSVLGFNFEKSSSGVAGQAASSRAYIPCPECGKLMNRTNFAGCSGVIVDWCKAHGTWFDRRELHLIIQFIQGGGLKKSRDRERAKLEEEKAHIQEEKRSLSQISRMAGEEPILRLQLNRDPDPLMNLFSDIWSSLKD